MGKNINKKIVTLGVILVVLLICIGIIMLADSLVYHSYSSGEVVIENLPEATTLPDGKETFIVDKGKSSEEDDYAYPSKVYKEEGIVVKSKEYLRSEYNKYETLFNKVVEKGDTPFSELDKNSVFTITEELLETGMYYQEGVWGIEESLDEFDYIDLSLDESGATIGIGAVYCYGGTKVIYKLNCKEPIFFVVDYSNTDFYVGTELVEMGSIFSDYLYLMPKRCFKDEIEGYTVYFSYYVDVVEGW